MPGAACIYAQTPCDGIAGCNSSHFDSEEDYAACITSAQSTIDSCTDDCQSDLDDTLSDDSDANDTCLETCSDTFDSASDDCSDAQTTCSAACIDPHTGFGDPACIAGCNEDLDTCLVAAQGPEFACEDDCSLTAASDGATAWDDYYDCNKDCCQGSDEDVEDPPISQCQNTCNKTASDCVNDYQWKTYWPCYVECAPLQAQAGSVFAAPSDISASNDCTSACEDGFEDNAITCPLIQQKCLNGCGCQDMQNQTPPACGWQPCLCYNGCQDDFTDASSDCQTTQEDETSGCDDTAEDCEANCSPDDDTCFAGCGTAQTECLSSASSDYDGCVVSATADLFDCRLDCCIDTHGNDAGLACYQECWHGSDCDHPDGCDDSFNDCVSGCDDGNDDGTLQTCNPCYSLASATFAVGAY